MPIEFLHNSSRFGLFRFDLIRVILVDSNLKVLLVDLFFPLKL